MDKSNFSGLTTALITPFKNNQPDFDSLERILYKQISGNVDAILLFGTTGEGLSLSKREKKSIFHFTKNILKEKIPIIACVSSPITHIAVDSVKEFDEWEANAIMAITPYYYRCTEEGVIQHFKTLTKSTSLPIIAYNVPSRTCCDIANMTNVIEYFNCCQQIIAIKEADGNLSNCLNLLTKTKLPLLCGNDKFLHACLNAGYQGSVSVISNLFPEEVKQIISLSKQNKKNEAESIFNNLLPIIETLDTLPNPITVKYAAKLLFDCSESLRLPLTPPDQATKLQIIKKIISYKEKA